VAVCYLHAYRGPRTTKCYNVRAVERALPGGLCFAVLGCAAAAIKEFERVSTTVINAYVGPALSRYLARLRAAPSRKRAIAARP